MNSLEFFISPSGQVMIEQPGEHTVKELTDKDYGFINEMYEMISSFYPLAFSCLKKIYNASINNEPYYKFLIVRRFIKCNFGQYDKKKDIDELGCFHFEFVSCPLRGECLYENSICSPQFDSKLSERELEVMKLYCSGQNYEEISGKLFISIFTVKNHIKSAFRKVNVHSRSEFVNYSNTHNLFEY